MTNRYFLDFRYYLLLISLPAIILSCNKKDFLDERPSSDVLIPRTLQDFRALLENVDVMSETPMMGEVSADNYYLSEPFYNSLKTREYNCYTWNKDIYFVNETNVGDWSKPYEQVFYANTVIKGLYALRENKGGDPKLFDALFGSAYFIRAFAFHNVAQVFSPAYDDNISTEENEFGIPLRLNNEIHDKVDRATVIDTYAQTRKDLWEAISYLPDAIDSNHLNRPNKPAAYALLSRVYITMRQYDSALFYAQKCLDLNNSLIDYNTAGNPVSPFPFSRKNSEILYQSRLLSSTNVLKSLVFSGFFVDSNLYLSYSTDDLRRSLFYFPNLNLKGTYSGSIFMFSGLATDEVYLIKAECQARAGNTAAAMDVLNQLLEKRYRTGTFVPLVAPNANEALDIVLNERRKQLPFRGIRWSDLRRLNKEGRNITVTRTVNGNNYELTPNNKKYVLPIPKDVEELGNVTPYVRN